MYIFYGLCSNIGWLPIDPARIPVLRWWGSESESRDLQAALLRYLDLSAISSYIKMYSILSF